jgi:hypothetical protein
LTVVGFGDSVAVVRKKSHKVGEAAAPYTAKKAVKGKARAAAAQGKAPAPNIRYATPAQAQKAAEEVFRVHEELFRKLAQ